MIPDTKQEAWSSNQKPQLLNSKEALINAVTHRAVTHWPVTGGDQSCGYHAPVEDAFSLGSCSEDDRANSSVV